MIKTFKFKLKTKPEHEELFVKYLDLCRELYNNALYQRSSSWGKAKKSISLYDQYKELTQIRKDLSEFGDAPLLVLRSSLKRLQGAFDNFFARVKLIKELGLKIEPGYPRYKSKKRYSSFGIGRARIEYGRVKVPKLGWIKFKQHQSFKGEIRDVSISREENGKWYVCISCDVGKAPPKRKPKRKVGMDLGLETFATLSDGAAIDNPRFFKNGQDLLAKRQRKLSKKKKGSNSYKKQKKLVSKAHCHIKNQRRDFAYKTTKKLFQDYDWVAIENLNIKSMIEDEEKNNQKSIYDAAWSIFINILKYKAEEAGVSIVEVNPAYTSQKCSRCENIVKKDLSIRMHDCPNCGLHMQRDLNAAINILSLGWSEARSKIRPTEAEFWSQPSI